MTKIYIGKVKVNWKGNDRNYVAGQKLYLSKHSWDCGWYWGMGYIGNKDLHTHFDSTFLKGTPDVASQIFDDQQFTDNEWWVIRDMFIQAYALKEAAAVYKHGGHQTTKTGITDIIKSEEMEKKLNADCGKILDMIWDYMNHSIKNQSVLKEEIANKKKEIDRTQEKIDKANADKKVMMDDMSKLKATLTRLEGGIVNEKLVCN